ncbi:uncharacterized protein K02A2.6-like [Cimex lectularius]|uniref:RNA-directed DNA polymerase n=1 Tax=Cimex lectularius TaxID=79782 RepID=A0A8I6SD44_CIMLE|nr:uncharacterized protein K02A2.6-like [Cimex lectularius]
MSTSVLPPPVMFNHESGSWTLFLKRLGNLFITYNVSDENIKKAYLLASLGDSTYNLLISLCIPSDPEETNVTFKNIADLLSNHFKPVRAILCYRQDFYSARQEEDENVTVFSARLRTLASYCAFGPELDNLLRDIFIMGLRDSNVKNRLMEEDVSKPDFDFAKALKLASSREATTNYQVNQPTHTIKTELAEIHNIRQPGGNKNKTTSKCFHCGWKNHQAKDCKFKNATCHSCSKVGHLASMCKWKIKRKVVSKHKFLPEEKEDEVCLSDSLFSIQMENNNDKPKPIQIELMVENKKHVFELDTGSIYNVISKNYYMNHFQSYPIRENDIRLTDYVGHPIRPIGKTLIPVNCPKYNGKMEFYIIDKGGPPLIGRKGLNLLNQTGVSQIFYNEMKICPDAPEDIRQILSEFPSVFSREGGVFSGKKVTLKVKENVRPVFLRARTLPIALKDKVEEELKRLVKEDILEPVDHSPWGTPIVPVLKPNGTIRVCGDYRCTVNPFLEETGNSLPRVDHLCSNFGGATCFSKINLRNAYQQLELDEESKQITTINTHMGLLRYKRLCFGISTAPAVFQRIMDKLLTGIKGVGTLLDDICVTGRTRQEHNQKLKLVLSILEKANLRANPTKCVFAQTSINYLGHVIDKNGLHTTDQHVKAIRNSPRPKDVTTLKSFLGMVTFYIKFIPKAAEILHPLYSLLKQNNRWIWSEKCEQAFKKIKQVLTSRPVLTHFNQKLPLRLTVDASAKAVGAVLSHVLPEGERPIAYASQVLNSAQQKYPSIEREAYAIIFGYTKFKDYLFCKEFELVTDHRPLMYIFGARKKLPVYAANRLQRWAYLISNYNYSIKCVKSKDNCADYLSRIDWGKQPAIDPLDEVNYFHFVAETVPFRLDWKKIKQGTRNDPELSRVVDSVVQGYRLPREIKYEPFIRRDKELTVEKGCLMWGYRVIIPQKFRETVLRELHANHFGSTKMKSLARSYFWWPSMDSNIENISKDCEVCCRFRENPPKSILQPWSWPSTTWTRLHVDFLGPINRNHC